MMSVLLGKSALLSKDRQVTLIRNLKGQCREMNNFLEGLQNQIRKVIKYVPLEISLHTFMNFKKRSLDD
jgi:hypothetical protein